MPVDGPPHVCGDPHSADRESALAAGAAARQPDRAGAAGDRHVPAEPAGDRQEPARAAGRGRGDAGGVLRRARHRPAGVRAAVGPDRAARATDLRRGAVPGRRGALRAGAQRLAAGARAVSAGAGRQRRPGGGAGLGARPLRASDGGAGAVAADAGAGPGADHRADLRRLSAAGRRLAGDLRVPGAGGAGGADRRHFWPQARAAATSCGHEARGESALATFRYLLSHPRVVGYTLSGAFNSGAFFVVDLDVVLPADRGLRRLAVELRLVVRGQRGRVHRHEPGQRAPDAMAHAGGGAGARSPRLDRARPRCWCSTPSAALAGCWA